MPSVRTQAVATRANALMVTREMGRTAQVSVCASLGFPCIIDIVVIPQSTA